MVWLTILAHIITLLHPYHLLSTTGMSELDKVLSLIPIHQVHKMSQDFSMKITVKKSIFMYFLAQFWCFKIFGPMRGVSRGDSLQIPNLQSIVYVLSFLTPSIPSFSKIWALVKSGCFTIICFSLCSSWGSKFLKLSLLLWVLNLVIFSTDFFIVWWSYNHFFVAFFLLQAHLNWTKSIMTVKCHSRFVRGNYFRKVNFHVFLGPILTL